MWECTVCAVLYATFFGCVMAVFTSAARSPVAAEKRPSHFSTSVPSEAPVSSSMKGCAMKD